MKKADHIIEFYGETCPHCISIRPIIESLEKELGLEIRKLEVWNDADNQKLMEEYSEIISEACGGFAAVPSFVNTKTRQALCGVHDKADIQKLIEGGDCKDNVCMPHSKMQK
ncbi:thioredoxin family protein [bacterium]|nr:thioredoxin family protein [bacterium]